MMTFENTDSKLPLTREAPEKVQQKSGGDLQCAG